MFHRCTGLDQRGLGLGLISRRGVQYRGIDLLAGQRRAFVPQPRELIRQTPDPLFSLGRRQHRALNLGVRLRRCLGRTVRFTFRRARLIDGFGHFALGRMRLVRISGVRLRQNRVFR